MQQKKKAKAAYQDRPTYKDGPSYAEALESACLSYDDSRKAMADEESSIRNRLSAQFRIPVEIVDEYLCFGEYISKPVLKTLADSKADKHFFDRAQKVKRQLVKIYRHDELSDQKIMVKVSEAILKMYNEYLETGKINTKDWQRFLKGENGLKKAKKRKPDKFPVRKSKKFEYWSGAPQPSEITPISLNELNKMLNEVYHGIKNVNVLDNNKLRLQADKVKKQCLNLAKIHYLIMELGQIQRRDRRRKAA
jgi:hypothetical protein